MAQSYIAMIVNNNSMERNSIIGVLKRDFNVNNIISAQNGKDALRSLNEQERVDWVFCDHVLPDGDAFGFIGEAKKLPKMERSAFILTAAKSDKEILMQAAAAGVNEFLLKPFTPNSLITKVRRVLESADRRTTDRLAPTQQIAAVLALGDTQYPGNLLDISLGGCLMKSEVFTRGGMVYDKGTVAITLEDGADPVKLESEVVRLERNPDYDNSRETFRVALRFLKAADVDITRLKAFITKLKQGK